MKILRFAKNEMQMEIAFEEHEIEKAAKHFLDSTKGFKIFAFSGELGAGKTTFINALCHHLNATENATSPTYSIIQEYRTTDELIIYHMDWYRLNDTEEALHAGVEDCLESGNICMIEWPERAMELLPEQTIFCTFKLISRSARKLTISIPR